MKIYKSHVFPLVLIILFVLALALAACDGSNTVAGLIVSDRQYTQKNDLESAEQPEQLAARKDIYASVYFIESARGTEYTAKWYIGGNEVKTDTQKLLTDRKGMIVFSLERDKVRAGTLRFEIWYDNYNLASKELVITEE